MIIATYKSDLNFTFHRFPIQLNFNSEKTLELKQLISFLPVEIYYLFTESNKLNYCPVKGLTARRVNIIPPSDYDFTIDCPVPFTEIDFTSMIDRGFKIKTIGEKINHGVLDVILDKV